MVKTRRRKTVKNRTMKKQIKNRQLRKRRTKKRGGTAGVRESIRRSFGWSLEKKAADGMYNKIDEILKIILKQINGTKITEDITKKIQDYSKNSKEVAQDSLAQRMKKIHENKIEGFKKNLKNIEDIKTLSKEDIQRLKETNKESNFIKHFLKNIIKNNKNAEIYNRIYYIFIFLIIVYYNKKMMKMNDVDIGNLKNSMDKDETIILKQIIESLENMFQDTRGLFNLINLADVFKNISIYDFKKILIENMYKIIYELKSPGGRIYKPEYNYELIENEAEFLNNEFIIYRFEKMLEIKDIDSYHDIKRKHEYGYKRSGEDTVTFNKKHQLRVHRKFVDALFKILLLPPPN